VFVPLASTTRLARAPLRPFALLAVIACAWLAIPAGESAAAGKEPAWQVYALRYATVHDFPIHDLVAGADTTRKSDIAMMFWLLEGPHRRRVLVDAGFYRQKFLDSWKPADFVSPAEVVRRCGIAPDSITDVIVSHIHWDHVDGADLFPNARVWLQRAEYEYYVGPEGQPLHEAIDTVDAEMLAKLHAAGRVQLVEGDGQTILPGLVAYTGGKHTYASQYVGVRTAKGTVIVASDNVYLYENLDKHAPIAQTLDAKSNLAAQDRMKKLASSLRLIVPGHDPAVFERFPGAGPGVVKVE
jgi:glyoxylase-like metal-dependent hydrolase (beta-lactamase superfamily II)